MIVKDLENNLGTIDQKIATHRGENFFSKMLITDTIYLELRDPAILKEKSKKIIDAFIADQKIKRYLPQEKHIELTWDSYFHGSPPYKERKNKNDIPDAWIYEGARDALAEPEHQSLINKLCLTGDGTMRDALTMIGFSDGTFT